MGKSTFFAETVLYLGMVSGFCSFCVGVVHIMFSLEKWCDTEEIENGEYACVGPLLIWNKDLGFYADANGVGKWRSFVTLEPNQFIDLWAPILISLITIYVHRIELSWCIIAQNWAVYSTWFIFAAIFSNFGYAGNFGIIAGFLSGLVGVLGLIVNFAGEDRGPCEFAVIRKKTTKKVNGGQPVESIQEEQEDTTICCNNSSRCRICSCHSRMGVACVRFIATASSLLTLLIGIVHVASAFSPWCDDSTTRCAGPYLIWNNNTDFFEPTNEDWRGTLGLSPGTFLDMFAPLIFGTFTLACHFSKGSAFLLVPDWESVLYLYLCVALFANFGYTGNLGILVGFISSTVVLCSLFILLSDNAHHPPFVGLEKSTSSPDGDSVDCESNGHQNAPCDDSCCNEDVRIDLDIVSEADDDDEKEMDRESVREKNKKYFLGQWFSNHENQPHTGSPKPQVKGRKSQVRKSGRFNFFTTTRERSDTGPQRRRKESDEESQELESF